MVEYLLPSGVGSAALWLWSRGSLTLWLEERETQAAESWRVREFMPFRHGLADDKRLRRSCVFVDTRFVSFPQGIGADDVSGLVKSRRKRSPGVFPPGICRNQYFKLESLILAQNERWRQA